MKIAKSGDQQRETVRETKETKEKVPRRSEEVSTEARNRDRTINGSAEAAARRERLREKRKELRNGKADRKGRTGKSNKRYPARRLRGIRRLLARLRGQPVEPLETNNASTLYRGQSGSSQPNKRRGES